MSRAPSGPAPDIQVPARPSSCVLSFSSSSWPPRHTSESVIAEHIGRHRRLRVPKLTRTSRSSEPCRLLYERVRLPPTAARPSSSRPKPPHPSNNSPCASPNYTPSFLLLLLQLEPWIIHLWKSVRPQRSSDAHRLFIRARARTVMPPTPGTRRARAANLSPAAVAPRSVSAAPPPPPCVVAPRAHGVLHCTATASSRTTVGMPGVHATARQVRDSGVYDA